MPRRVEHSRERAVDALELEAELPELTLARFHFLTHVRSSSSGRCPCCESDCAKIDADLPDFELLIDTVEGERYIRHERRIDEALFDELAEQATVVDVPLRCAATDLSILTEEDVRVLALLGGARSRKTNTMLTFGLRRWGKRGGAGRHGWMLGPELDRAFLLVEKWALGEDGVPPLCPHELMISWPDSLAELKVKPSFRMIDDFVWTAKHAAHQGRNLTARNIEIVMWTEAATTRSEVNFTRARGRIVKSKGIVVLDAVPEPRNWVSTSVIEPAKVEATQRAAGELTGRPTYRTERLSIADNVYIDKEEADAFKRDLVRIDPRMAAREADGDWAADNELCFEFVGGRHDFDPVDPYTDALEHLGLVDITEIVTATYFSRGRKHLAIGDINAYPHTNLVLRFGARPKASPYIPCNWHVVFVDLMQLYGLDSDQAAQELARYRNGRYEGAAFILDATSTRDRHNAGGALNQRRQIIPREAYERAKFEVMGPVPHPTKAGEFTNPDRYDGTLIQRQLMRFGDPEEKPGTETRFHVDRRTCMPFINALQNQKAEADGVTPEKIPQTRQDRLIGAFTDCARYGLWPFFSLEDAVAAGEPMKAQVFG